MFGHLGRVLAIVWLAVPLAGQVTMRATARQFYANGRAVPAGTDITAGAQVSTTGGLVTFASVASAAEIRADLRTSTSWLSSRGGRPSLTARGDVDLDYTSPAPVAVSVSVTLTLVNGGAAIVTVGSLGTVDAANPAQTFDTVIDSSGLPVVLDTASGASAVPFGGFSLWSQDAIVEVLVTPRAMGTPYGTPCGATLDLVGTLAAPQQTLTIAHDSGPALALLWVGQQQIVAPIRLFVPWAGSCPVRTDMVAVAPLLLDANGQASFALLVPSGAITLQAATANPAGTINTSNGIDLSP
ncbi:MAG: hypothetical protein AAF628_34315 [Planctomycetota bacterium]